MVVWLRVIKDISSGGRGITLKGAAGRGVGAFYWGASGAPRLRWGLGLQLRWGRPPHGYPLWLYGRWGDIVPCRVGCWRPKAPQGVPARRPFVEGGRPWMRGIDCAHGDFRGSTSLGAPAARVPPVAPPALGRCCVRPRGGAGARRRLRGHPYAALALRGRVASLGKWGDARGGSGRGGLRTGLGACGATACPWGHAERQSGRPCGRKGDVGAVPGAPSGASAVGA